MTAPRDYVSAGKPGEREPSLVRRRYTCWETSSAQRQCLLTGKTHPSWHHLVVRACINVSSWAQRWEVVRFSDPQQCSFSSERENKKQVISASSLLE